EKPGEDAARDGLPPLTPHPCGDAGKAGDWKKGAEIQTQKPAPEATRHPGPL
uniref:Uncharacterized protein n=1 Tax=Aotus nancymaae TaxID=37293 RepID=A0A2K5EJ05_AOTNA